MRKTATLDPQNRIEFASRGAADDAFGVVRFQGEEGLSRPYRFEIELVSELPDLDLDAMLANEATLSIVNRGTRTRYHGVIDEFEELHQKNGDTFYRAVLVPKLWQLSLFRVNEVYVDRSTPEIIEAVLQEGGLTTLDYELALTAEYTPWTHLCEYQESHLDFISRLMERDGIYYFFEQGDDRAKLVITDNLMRHKAIEGGTLAYEPVTGLQQTVDRPAVFSLLCRQKRMPQKVILMDYNYRRPSLEIRSEAVVDAEGRGEVYFYGEHADTVEESTALSKIRAEEIACRKRTFSGESNVADLRAGGLAEVTGHFRRSFNQRYLVTEVSHEGSQAGAMLPGEAVAGSQTAQGMVDPFYRNTFAGIPRDVQFRPERLTPKPRIHGTMNAVIDAESSGVDPELDEAGRYKVKITFDRTKKGEAKASQSVRMATPYAGSDHGMHFPLRKGTEVLLTFIDGDPNRPIIAGAVPNTDAPSVANSSNERAVVGRYRGGMDIVITGSGRTQMAGVGAQATNSGSTIPDAIRGAMAAALDPVKYPELLGNEKGGTGDDATEGILGFGLNRWEIDNGWGNDAITFDLDKAPGTKTVNTVNNVLHSYSSTCERYLGPVVTTIVGNNNLTVRGSAYTYVGTATSTANAETDLAGYTSDVSQEGEGGALRNIASFMQLIGDSASSTRTDANVDGSSVSVIEGNSRSTIRGTNVSLIMGDSDTTVRADSFNKYVGRTNNIFIGNTFLMYFGAQEVFNISASFALNIGITTEIKVAAVGEVNIGGIATVNIGPSMTIDISKSGIAVNETETKISKLEAAVSKTSTDVSYVSAAVNELGTRASKVEAAANDIKAKTNEIATRANLIQSKVNGITSSVNEIDSSLVVIMQPAIKLIA